MTIKKERKKKLVWLIVDEKNLPINIKDYRRLIKGISFPNNFIVKYDEKILVFLNSMKNFSKLEFNHNLIWVGVKLYNFCTNDTFEIVNTEVVDVSENISLGWCMGEYKFTKFKSNFQKKKNSKLTNITKDQILDSKTFSLVRDLVNTPANILGPRELFKEAKKIFSKSADKIIETEGKELKEKFPLVYSVGMGAENKRKPIFSEFIWKSKNKKTIILIGKGVCFDTGGLNLKLGAGMNLMKKDMGGAANCIGLAKMITEKKLDINLRLLLPIVENSLSGRAMRPSDIIKSRKGLYIEIGDTDAEGRLILADALFYASEKKPDLIIDMATLTGASRVALGTDVPSFFTNHEKIAENLIKFSKLCGDPLWQLPLWRNYTNQLHSNHADTNNIGSSNFGGAITAALFLEKFVKKEIPWIHIDLMSWSLNKNLTSYVGGEVMGIRSLFHLIKDISNN